MKCKKIPVMGVNGVLIEIGDNGKAVGIEKLYGETRD